MILWEFPFMFCPKCRTQTVDNTKLCQNYRASAVMQDTPASGTVSDLSLPEEIYRDGNGACHWTYLIVRITPVQTQQTAALILPELRCEI